MKIIETKVYTLDELSDGAKEVARGWWRQISTDADWHEFLYDEFAILAELFGLDLERRKTRLMNGLMGHGKPVIYFSGFYSQGDGACFEGTYRYKKGGLKAIKQHCPEDKELHAIVRDLTRVQQRHGYKLIARMSHRGHYYHSGCMVVDIEKDCFDRYMGVDAETEQELTDALRGFADWIYSQLKKEYEFRMTDEQVDEAIRCNEYTFTESGRRYG